MGQELREDTMQRKLLMAIAVVVLIISMGLTVFSVVGSTDFRPIRVACVGDSITQYSYYTNKLQTLLGVNYIVGNFGVAGSTVSHDSKIPYSNQTTFKNAIHSNPDIVLIMLGTNDANPEIAYSTETFEEDYANLVTAFQDLPNKPHIVVVGSPPIFATASTYNNTYLVNTIIPHTNNIAVQMNLSTVDMYSVFGEHADYFADGVHPNDDGSTLIASTMYDTVTSIQDCAV